MQRKNGCARPKTSQAFRNGVAAAIAGSEIDEAKLALESPEYASDYKLGFQQGLTQPNEIGKSRQYKIGRQYARSFLSPQKLKSFRSEEKCRRFIAETFEKRYSTRVGSPQELKDFKNGFMTVCETRMEYRFHHTKKRKVSTLNFAADKMFNESLQRAAKRARIEMESTMSVVQASGYASHELQEKLIAQDTAAILVSMSDAPHSITPTELRIASLLPSLPTPSHPFATQTNYSPSLFGSVHVQGSPSRTMVLSPKWF